MLLPAGEGSGREAREALRFLVARGVLAGHVAGGVCEAAGIAAAVECAVNAGNRFACCVEALHRLHVPAEHFRGLL